MPNTVIVERLLAFEELPPARTGMGASRFDWHQIASELQGRPGEWARLPVDLQSAGLASNVAANIRRGIYAAMRPTGAFEAAARTVDGEYVVYARYVNPRARRRA